MPGAVTRNYIKRVLRELFRTRTSFCGLDVVILARTAFSHADIGKVEIELQSLLSKLQEKAPMWAMTAKLK